MMVTSSWLRALGIGHIWVIGSLVAHWQSGKQQHKPRLHRIPVVSKKARTASPLACGILAVAEWHCWLEPRMRSHWHMGTWVDLFFVLGQLVGCRCDFFEAVRWDVQL